MGEKVILVCDVCGQPAVQSVGVKVNGRSLTKDVCAAHLREVVAGARPSRRGRRRSVVAAADGQTVRRPASATSTARKGSRTRSRAKANSAV